MIRAADGAVACWPRPHRDARRLQPSRCPGRDHQAPGDSVLNVGQIVRRSHRHLRRRDPQRRHRQRHVRDGRRGRHRRVPRVDVGHHGEQQRHGSERPIGGDVAITVSAGRSARVARPAAMSRSTRTSSRSTARSAPMARQAPAAASISPAPTVSLQTVDAMTSARGTDGGSITVRSGGAGLTFISGRVDVNASTGHGGEIRILGGNIALAGAAVAANGPLGGGTILIGGDAQGANPTIANTRLVYAGVGTIRANALTSGDGGRSSCGPTTQPASARPLTAPEAVRRPATAAASRSPATTTFGGTASASAPRGEAAPSCSIRRTSTSTRPSARSTSATCSTRIRTPTVPAATAGAA